MDLSCSQVLEIAESLIDDEPLSAKERKLIEDHLNNCYACRYDFEFNHMIRQLIRDRVPFVSAPEQTLETIRSVEN